MNATTPLARAGRTATFAIALTGSDPAELAALSLTADRE
jgi:hypothetical protein